MAEISYLLSHFNAMCDNICVVCVKPAEAYICWALSKDFMPKQSLCIFGVVILKRNLTIIMLIRTRSDEYCRVFQCDRNPDKGRATQHASGTTLNKPAQKLKKENIRNY